MAYWLLKSEPDAFSIDDLARERVAQWDGVRNYQARNNLRAMRVGEHGFFYHSSADPPGIAGVLRIAREAYSDATQFDPASKYHDPRSSPDAPRWWAPDVEFAEKFPCLLPLPELRDVAGLEDMALFRRVRLSVQPVTDEQWKIIIALAEAT